LQFELFSISNTLTKQLKICLESGMDSKKIWGTLDPFYESGAILGRKVANTSFLDALLREDPFDEYHFFPGVMKVCQDLSNNISKKFPEFISSGRIKIFDRRELPAKLGSTDYHCFHQSDCILYPQHIAGVRNRYGKRIFPITSLTHSLSYSDYGQSFLSHMWSGISKRDCIISTSRAGVGVVENYFKILRKGYSLDEKRFPAPSVRRIPLGLDTAKFAAPDEIEAVEAAKRLGIYTDDDKKCLNMLVFGRISHFSKMDILPLLRAIRKIFKTGIDKNSLRLVLAGWAEPGDDFPDALQNIAGSIGLKLSIFKCPSEKEKLDLYKASDIFISIADNPQETFGITVIEALSMGIPAVVSDYDGYRDLVQDGITGFLIPTIGPADTQLTDVMAPLLYDNNYHLQISQTTIVETNALAEALLKLIKDSALRSAMASEGIKRVRSRYNWSQIISDHVELWEELNNTPVDTEILKNSVHPSHVAFGEVFKHYTSRIIAPDTKVSTSETGQAIYHGVDFPLIYKGLEYIIDENLINKAAFFARKNITVEELVTRLQSANPASSTERIINSILWCLKHDILEPL
jgi:glycosyltransferase involved in cell wall biosynthesis